MELKIALFIVLFSVTNVFATNTYSQVAKVTLNMDNKSLEQVMDEIETQSEFYFVFNQKQIDVNRIVNIQEENKLITDILPELFKGTNVNYMVFDRKILLTTDPLENNLLTISSGTEPQQNRITGTVTEKDGTPLPGVNVVVTGTTLGAMTDIDGKYSIEIPQGARSLTFSFVGMVPQEITIGTLTQINVTMSVSAVSLEEIVVIGYGTQRREAISGSVGTIQGAELAQQQSLQVSSALMGRIPGVQVTQNSGQPGRNTGDIKIRGIGTLGNSNPLVLIDGVSGDIDDVPASDIENISVLKDASSAAIYGSRAANGVILITTKRGREQPMRVNYYNNFGFRYPTNLPEFVDGGTFMRMENLGATNLGVAPTWSDSHIQEWETKHISDPDNYPNTDWVNEVFTKQAMQQTHNIGVTGGGTNFKYRGTMQYDDETAQIKNYGFQRYNIRLNTDITASKVLSFSFDVNASRSNLKEPSSGLYLIMNETYRLPPIYLARYSNGNFGSGYAGSRNPAAEAEVGGISSDLKDFFRGNFVAKFKPFERLQFNLTYAPSINMGYSKNMRKQWKAIDPLTQEVLTKFPERNLLTEQLNRSNQHTIIFTAEYKQKIADHTFNLLGGSEYIDYGSNYFGASRDNFTLQDFDQLNSGSSANKQNWGSATQWKLLSFFGRADYNYKDKYLFLTNLRYDGSSRFTEENRWGFFPSFSLAWRISEEQFMESFDFLDDFKIRGSWGIIGNQDIGNYPFAAVINLGQNYIFGNQIADGAAQTSLANSNITWEDTRTINLGFDMSLLNSKINIKFDLFDRKTSNILLALPVPLIIGMNAPYQNAGVVKNTGWEFDVVYNDDIGTDFTYSIGLNASNVNNEVIDLHDAGPFISGSSIIKEGYPINSIYGYKSDGLFKSQEEIDGAALQLGNIAPGDIKYIDLNDDGLINESDRDIIGNPFPSFNYGINFSATYKNLDISAFFQGVGRKDLLLQGETVWAFYNGGRIQPWQIESYWREDSPNNSYPRLTRATTHSNFSATDFWVYNASYLRLRNLQIGFELPDRWIGSIAERGRIYFAGENLFTLFNKMPPGIDPNIPNATYGSFFPVNRLYSLGIEITF